MINRNIIIVLLLIVLIFLVNYNVLEGFESQASTANPDSGILVSQPYVLSQNNLNFIAREAKELIEVPEDGEPGAVGPEGPKGDRGLPGTAGQDGDPGTSITGPPGASGSTGQVGPKGPPGPPGPPGSPGLKGEQGRAGTVTADDGSKKIVGDPGPRGADGDDGPPGPKGDKGDPGDSLEVSNELTIERPNTNFNTGEKGKGSILFKNPENDVTGGIEVQDSRTSFSDGNKNDLLFMNRNGSDLNTNMVIKSSGNVGIGTASPSEKLVIGGNEDKLCIGDTCIDKAALLALNNLKAGKIEGDLTVTGNAEIGKVGKIKGDLTVTGNAEIGNAYIGKHHLTSNEFAQFSHKAMKNNNRHAMLQRNNGQTILNNGHSEPLQIRQNNSAPFVTIASNGPATFHKGINATVILQDAYGTGKKYIHTNGDWHGMYTGGTRYKVHPSDYK